MAIHLQPKNNKMEEVEIDYIGWSYLEKLLRKLGQSTINFSFLETNEFNRGKLCRKWGEAILEGLEEDEIREIKVEDPTSKGNYRLDPIIKSVAVSRCEIHELSESDKEWLREIANFMIDCLGFRQLLRA